MLYSFHTHIFPDALAPRAIGTLADTAQKIGISAHADGTMNGTEQYLVSCGIGGALVCNIATNAHQMHKVNDFAIFTHKSSTFFEALGSLHPGADDLEAEIHRLQDAGIRGIKIHPDYVGLFLDGQEFEPILALCEHYGMFVITHMGLDPLSPECIHATPKMALSVKERHPELTLVCAHMGGCMCRADTEKYLIGTDIYLDTSLCTLTPDESDILIQMMHHHNPRRLLFGTDTPWTDAKAEADFLTHAQLGQSTYDLISYQNAYRLLGKES